MAKRIIWQTFWIVNILLLLTSCALHQKHATKKSIHRTDHAKKWSKEEKLVVLPEKYYWPVEGKKNQQVVHFGETGLDIRSMRPATVIAVSEGRVIYAGEGVRKYGKMMMVRHAQDVVSIYTHNQSFLVKEGDYVKAKQPIAKTSHRFHFELRRQGKPVNPKYYLG